jgi:hypothetical protein
LRRRGKRCEIRHAKRVSVEYLSIDADDVVEYRHKFDSSQNCAWPWSARWLCQ